ncbi:hypothetical protein AB1Y20_002162 [Prymnesium parvum]|uniref:Uncharacterized protein n=1 Tax=Prymnesium parvum TaxID=97485 RepID=A0AB34JA73_PRYPA
MPTPSEPTEERGPGCGFRCYGARKEGEEDELDPFSEMLLRFPARATALLHSMLATAGAATTGAFLEHALHVAKRFNNVALHHAYITILRRSVELTEAVLAVLLPKYLSRIRIMIQKEIARLHNKGIRIPLGEEGWLANYSLEVLRLSKDGGQSYRRVTTRHPHHHKEVKYELARTINPFAPVVLPDTAKVSGRGLIKRLTCRVVPRVIHHYNQNGTIKHFVDATQHVAAAVTFHSKHKHEEVPPQPTDDQDDISEAADRYIESRTNKCHPCVAQSIKKCLPRCVKGKLPFEMPPSWMPRGFRHDPAAILHLAIDLDLALRFDSTKPHVEAATNGAADHYTSIDVHENPFEFEVAIVGHNGWPSLGQLQIKNFALSASAHVWLDLFGERAAIAFIREHPPDVDWKAVLSLCGCGLPLPSLIENRILCSVVKHAIRFFDRSNPITIDLSEKHVTETDKMHAKEDHKVESTQAAAASVPTSSSKLSTSFAAASRLLHGKPHATPSGNKASSTSPG